MIVLIKNQLSEILKQALDTRVRIRTARFNESTENRPQKDLEIGIYHQNDSFVRTGKGTYLRNYRYQLELAIKNLRTDDEIQDLVDFVVYSLLAASIFGHEIIIEKTDNLGIDNQAIWRYTIAIYIGINTSKDTINCEFTTSDFSFDSVNVNLYPSYTKPLIEG